MGQKISQNVSRDIIEFLKEKRGMTLSEIAKLAGTTKTFVLKIESGRANFTVKHLSKMEEKMPIFVLLGKHQKEKLIAKYAEKNQEVPTDMLEMLEALIEVLRACVKLRKATKEKD